MSLIALGDGGSDPLTTTPRLFASVRLITKTSTPTTAIKATAPTPIPAFAPVESPVSGPAAAAATVAATAVVVVAAALAVDDTLDEPDAVWLVLAALAVVVMNTRASVALPNIAATKSLR